MSHDIFNLSAVKMYQAMLGADKLSALWAEYQQTSADKLKAAENLLKAEDWHGLRIVFHAMRSSSVVFGLDKFAELCTKIEDAIMCDDDCRQDMAQAMPLWQKSVDAAEAFFQDKNYDNRKK